MAAPSGTMPCWRVLLSVTHTMLRANQMQHATSPCVGHHRGDMQPPLLRTLPRLSDASSATPAAGAAMAVPSGTMPSWRVPLSVTQTMLRANQSNAAGNNPVMADFVVATVQGPYQYIRHGFPHTAATCCPQQSQDGAMFWRPRTMHIRAMLRPTVGQGAPRGGSNALTDVCVTEGDVRRLGIVSSSTKDAPPAAGNVLEASDSHDNALSNRGGMPPPQ